MFRIRKLLAEIQDGVELIFVVEDNCLEKTIKIIKGQGGELPIKVRIKVEEEDSSNKKMTG